MAKKIKKLGAAKKVFIFDPEDAERVLELGDKKFVFKHDAVEKLEVTGAEAKALIAKYPYLKVA